MKLPHVLAPFMDTQTLSYDQAKVVIGKIEKTDPDSYKALKADLDELESEGKPVPCISSGAAPGKTASELIWRQELQIGAKKNKNIVDETGEFSPIEFIKSFQDDFKILPKELRFRSGESDAVEEEVDEDWINNVDKYLSFYQPDNKQALQYKIELLSVLVFLEAPLAMAGQKDEENANKLAQDFAIWLATPEGSKAMIRMACADVLIGMPDRIVGNTHTGNFSWDGSNLWCIDNAKTAYDGQPIPPSLKRLQEGFTISGDTFNMDSYGKWIAKIQGESGDGNLTSSLVSTIKAVINKNRLGGAVVDSFEMQITEDEVLKSFNEVLSATKKSANASDEESAEVIKARIEVLKAALKLSDSDL